MLADLLMFALSPQHAGTIIACMFIIAFLKLALSELSR